MTFLDLFAGVGGFRRGMELAGHECVGFCEWDKYAAMSYISMHLITPEQRKYLETLPIKQRQKEILKEEYRNGEWYVNDIRSVNAGNIPKAECWCFGAPCQDFSVAGNRKGLEGDRSSLIREIFRILEELKEEDKPEWLIYENVKGMFSSNRGLDYLTILSELDRGGYDVEWQIINSNWFVPQNRERVYTVGHLRRYGRSKVFPIETANGANSVSIIGHREGYRRNLQTYSSDGITEALDTAGGGGREFHVAEPLFCDMRIGGYNDVAEVQMSASEVFQRVQQPSCRNLWSRYPIMCSRKSEIRRTEIGGCLMARDYKGIGNQEMTAVCIPVLTPERVKKRQNGRRFKENGDDAFTLTAQDKHGVAIGIDDTYGYGGVRIYEDTMPTLRSERNGLKVGKEVMGVIDTQGRANKSVTPKNEVLTLRAETHENQPCVVEVISMEETEFEHPGMYVQFPNGVTAYALWYEKEQCYITIRKLTPRECFRLQGWTDDYFDKAQFVNSDSQLYKQAGNGVTVPVVRAVAEKLIRCIS